MIPYKLHLKIDDKNGIKEILDSNNDNVSEVLIDWMTPSSWALSEVEQSWTTMSDEEKLKYAEKSIELIKNGTPEEEIKFTLYQVSINNFQYKVYLTSYEAYESLFLSLISK